MSLPTYYAQVMLGLHKKFGLSENAKKLLEAHDDWKLGRIDQDELGRIVRMSPNMRKAIIDTITKVNNMMKKKPEESKMCIEIIQACTEIMTALESTPSMRGFPLMKLPAEVRQRVYGFYINNFTRPKANAVTYPTTSKCQCPRFEPSGYRIHKVDLSLARTCSKVRDEFLEYFYRETRLYFTCGCELRQRLNNEFMQMTLRNIKVHWTGPESDKAFLLLAKCPKLSKLDIVISKSTTAHLTVRETEMRRFFTSSQRQPRIADALGMDELLMIRGIDEVTASHQSYKQTVRKSEEERASLQSVLRAKLKGPSTGDDE